MTRPVHIRHMGACISMHVTVMGMTVTPDHHFFEQKKNQNAAQNRERDGMRVNARVFERVRQDREKRRAQQGADGETHHGRQHPRAHALRQQQKSAGREHAQRAAEDGEGDNPENQGIHVSETARRESGHHSLPRVFIQPDERGHAPAGAVAPVGVKQVALAQRATQTAIDRVHAL